MQAPRPYTTKSRLLILVFCWGLPMLLSGYGLFATVQKKKKRNICSVAIDEMDYWRSIHICARVVGFFIILTLSLISMKRLHKPQAIVTHMTEEQARARLKRTSRAVKMVLCSLLLYTTYYPIAFYRFGYIVIFSRDRKQHDNVCLDWETLVYVTRFLPLVNSCLIPFVYLLFLKDYQEGARKMLCGCFQRRRHQGPAEDRHSAEGISSKNTVI